MKRAIAILLVCIMLVPMLSISVVAATLLGRTVPVTFTVPVPGQVTESIEVTELQRRGEMLVPSGIGMLSVVMTTETTNLKIRLIDSVGRYYEPTGNRILIENPIGGEWTVIVEWISPIWVAEGVLPPTEFVITTAIMEMPTQPGERIICPACGVQLVLKAPTAPVTLPRITPLYCPVCGAHVMDATSSGYELVLETEPEPTPPPEMPRIPPMPPARPPIWDFMNWWNSIWYDVRVKVGWM